MLGSLLFLTFGSEITGSEITLIVLVFLLKLSCCLSVLRVLKRPGPGEEEREWIKKHEDEDLQDNFDHNVVYGAELSFV